jgi:peroxiredoxin Q/BCP
MGARGGSLARLPFLRDPQVLKHRSGSAHWRQAFCEGQGKDIMSEMAIQIGQRAPDFSLAGDQGNRVKLSEFLGKRVVLYFYPKDNTPGCTRQACGFRDAYSELQGHNAVVIGISPDGSSSHAKFRKDFELPFLLLSDPDHKVAERYGVWGEKKFAGKKYWGIVRSHFVLDEGGSVLDAQVGVTPEKSVELALATLAEK